MNTRLAALKCLTAGLLVLLAGCATMTLPQRSAKAESYIALVVEVGTMPGKFWDAVPFLNSNLSEEFLPLKSGITFLKVPEGLEEVKLMNINLSSPRQIGFPYRSTFMGFTIKRPADGTLLLVAKKYRYIVKNGFLSLDETILSDEEAAKVLGRWEKENRETRGDAPWEHFEIVRPVTVR